uniref:NADH-ubiquinone oxidoreductase chain 4L n=1 Tax=Aspasma minima TaxID=181476 RepID=Q8HKQ3_ASPMI|nr:NADH dehydrogenase subunit 4L [Aspasma minima]BAC23795.1 NADH dehydrogenase subunit 4L [Aspasma minima]
MFYHFILTSAFTISLTGLAFQRTHLMSALLCLEGMMLSLYTFLSLWSLQLSSINFTPSPLLLLAFSACEAGAGLSLLVATAHTYETDHLHNLTLLQC